MKKWMFVIFPGILLLIFLFFYHQTTAMREVREQAHAEAVAQQKAADAAHKQMIEDKARQDAEKRAADAAADEAKKEADAAAKKKAERDKIQGETDKYNAEIDRYTTDNATLQAQLDGLKKQEDQDNRAEFDLEKRVQDARVTERTSELDIQRMVDMIATRAAQSYLTRMPAPPPPKSSD